MTRKVYDSVVKVCHMTSAHDSNDVRIFYKECTSLVKAGYDTYLVASGESREEHGVHVIGVGMPSGGRLSRMTRFAKKVYNTARSLDAEIYHIHDPELLPYGWKLLRKGKKVIFDSHEDTPSLMSQKMYVPKPLRGVVRILYTIYEKSVLSKFSAVIGVSPHICRRLEHENNRVAMITNYPFRPMTDITEATNKKFAVCFAGGVSSAWCHDSVLRAISTIQDLRYTVLGTAAENYIKSLQAEPGAERLDYLGVVDHREVDGILRCHLAGMALLHYSPNTAWKEGTLGNTKLFEYMSAGLPVICTDFMLWREIVEENHCGFAVSPDETAAVASALRTLADCPELAIEMGKNARALIDSKYNWESQVPILLGLYEQIISQ